MPNRQENSVPEKFGAKISYKFYIVLEVETQKQGMVG